MMAGKVKIHTIADVPVEFADEWLQHLRDFDTAHPGSHFQVFALAPEMTIEEVKRMMNVDPPLPVMNIYKKH
jgi:hypothetical protein